MKFFITKIAGEFFAAESFVRLAIKPGFMVIAEFVMLAISAILFTILGSILFKLRSVLKLKERF
jgi:hypothetical protein